MFALSVLGPSGIARAQREAPELIEMPPVYAEGEPRSVEVAIEIDVEGRARAIECDAPDALCAAIDEALREARFRPARLDGRPAPSRTRLAVRVSPPPVAPQLPPARVPPSPYGAPALGVTAEVRREQAGVQRLELDEARDTPGALGDPFRAVLTLPGVVPMMDGLPYFYLRGAPPAGTIYVYDGIQLPALYHLAAGPAVVHPQMVGAIDVHSGVAPIEYGGHTGGVVVGEGPPERREEAFGEAEIRAIDLNGFAQGRVGDVTLSAATRIGYPGLLLSAFAPNVGLVYWDYQARGRLALDGGHRLELVALGSYDQFSIAFPDDTGFALTLAFHRVELRHVYQDAQTEIGLALRFGHDESSFDGVDALTPIRTGLELTLFGTRFWIHRREGDLRLRFGGQAIGASGTLFTLDEGDPSTGSPIQTQGAAGARRRITTSLYASVEWRALRELRLIGGVRGDLWVTPGVYEAAIDPRLRLVWDPIPELTLHAAGGVARQPAVLPIPLPGLSELPMSMGLQTAIQSEVGATARIRADDLRLRLGGTVFVHHYDNLVSPELLNPPSPACTRQGLCRLPPADIARPESLAYGLELSIRAEMGRHFSGRLAYTLAEVESDPYAGEVAYTPSYDIRHVLNVVLQYDSRAGFIAGVRAFLRSGATQGFTFLSGQDLALERYEQRLPAFGRLDAMVGYGWDAGWADLRLTLEWRNATFAIGGEPQGLMCMNTASAPEEPCGVRRNPAIFFPNLGLRGTFR